MQLRLETVTPKQLHSTAVTFAWAVSAPSAVIPFKASGFKVRESCVSPMLVLCQCTNGTTDFTAAVAFEHRAACDSSCLKPVANLAVHVRRPGGVAF
jgi:hypothetical protein